MEGGAQVLATYLGWIAGLAVLEVKAIVCWGQHLGLYSLGFELKPLRNKAVAKRDFRHCVCCGDMQEQGSVAQHRDLEPLPLS